jgi:hypothetical protein
MINPFQPVITNILRPLATSQMEPYVTLYNKSIRPLYESVMKPCKDYAEAVVRYKAFIKTVELAAQFTVYFFLYQKGWRYGTHHLGLPGGAAAFSLIYAAGCWVDGQLKTNMNDICTGTWLYYKGVRNFGSNREAMLLSIIIAGHLTHKHQEDSQASGWDAKRQSAAEWIAQCFFKKPEPLQPNFLPDTAADSRGGESLDCNKNPGDG